MADWWEKDPTAEEGEQWWAADQPAGGDVSRETTSERNVFESMPGTMGRMATGFRAAVEDPAQFARDFGEGVDTAVRSAADVLMLGAADEAAAAARSALGEDYETALAEERARDEAADPALRLAGALPAAVAAGGVVGAPKTLLQALAQAGGFGAAYGFGSGTGGAAERATEAAKGGALGAAVGAPVYGVANVIAPRISQALQALRQEGVRPTVGQLVGPFASRVEQRAGSIPVVGDVIRGAQTRALEDFNRGAINHALRPAGMSLKQGAEAGRKAIAEADDLLAKGYDEALDLITDAVPDQAFQQDIARIAATAANRLGRKGQRAFANALDDVRSLPALQKQSFNGKEIKQAVSGLRQDADRLSKSADEDTFQAGQLVREVRDAVSDLMKRNTTPDNAARLTGLDRAYAGFQRVRNASEAGRDGVFTPFQLTQAIKRGEKAGGRRSFARGEGLGQEFAEAGEEIISSRVPDSGTPERLLTALAVGGYFEPTAALAAGAASLPYTRLGQNVIAGLAMRQPSRGAQILAESLRRSAIPAAAGAVAARE